MTDSYEPRPNCSRLFALARSLKRIDSGRSGRA